MKILPQSFGGAPLTGMDKAPIDRAAQWWIAHKLDVQARYNNKADMLEFNRMVEYDHLSCDRFIDEAKTSAKLQRTLPQEDGFDPNPLHMAIGRQVRIFKQVHLTPHHASYQKTECYTVTAISQDPEGDEEWYEVCIAQLFIPHGKRRFEMLVLMGPKGRRRQHKAHHE